MNNTINQYNLFELLSPAFNAKSAFQGESEWKQVFDKLMMGVFTRDGGENEARANRQAQDLYGEVSENNQNYAGSKNLALNLFQKGSSIPYLNQTQEVTSVDLIRNDMQMIESRSNIAFAVDPTNQGIVVGGDNETTVAASSRYWEMIRKKLLSRKMDRLHIVLAQDGIKIYVRSKQNDEEIAHKVLREVIAKISHRDYAITEIKINGRNFTNYRG